MRRMAQRIAELFRPGVRKPDLRTVARTGDARYVPQINRWGRDRQGRVAVMASRLDSITIRDYDRVRFYPVVRDALAVLRVPVSRARFHFHCPERPEIAELAQAVLAPKVRPLLETLVRGAFEFGHQVVEKRWQPVWDVSVGDGDEAARYPFVWNIRKFASLSPADTVLLVHPRSGEFAGVRQFAVGATISDVPRAKCVWYVNDQEFDGNYGVPRTKAAVPYVEIAESIWDDMAKHSKRFAVAWTVGRHRPGFSAGPDGSRVDNAVTMAETMEGLESGHSVSLPAEYDAASGNPYWGIEVTTPPAEDRYVEKLKFVNDVIRMACVVPDKASSQTAETGTYNLGETQIELFLENAEAILDDLKTVIEEQLLGDFVDYNFGPDAPRLRIVFQPLDVKIKRMLLNALVGLLGQGPVALADGREIEADWEDLAGDAGVPLKIVDAQDRARQLMQAARERLAALDGEEDPSPPSGAKLAEDQPREPKGQPGGGQFAKKSGAGGVGGAAEDLTRTKGLLPDDYREAYSKASPSVLEPRSGEASSTSELRRQVRETLRSKLGDGVWQLQSSLGPMVITGKAAKKMVSGSWFDERTANVIENLETVLPTAVLVRSEPHRRNDSRKPIVHRLVARIRQGDDEFAAIITANEFTVQPSGWPGKLRAYSVEDVEVK